MPDGKIYTADGQVDATTVERGAADRTPDAAERRIDANGTAPRIYVCAGPGGVGKTTVSAALALGFAISGRRVAVVTIDPAKRLATALGLKELSGEPQHLDERVLGSHGLELSGELWAMTLDVKSTLDRLVCALAPDVRTSEEILGNRIYKELSAAVAGSQELSAVAKLHQLHHEGGFDVIVLDTPPSRHVLDFLDAPTRLERFLGGKALGVFLAPSSIAARLLGRPGFLLFSIFARIAGVDLLSDLTDFFKALAGTIEGLNSTARSVGALLRDPSTTSFLLITSPERDPVAEVRALRSQLAELQMPFGRLVVNRVHLGGLEGHSPEEVRSLLAPELGERLAVRVAENLADFDVLVQRDAESVAELSGAIGDGLPIIIPHLHEDIHDVESLAKVAGLLLR